MNLKDEILANRNNELYFSKDKFNKKEKSVLNRIKSIKRSINKYIDDKINFQKELNEIIVNKLSHQQKCFINLDGEDYQFETIQSRYESKQFEASFMKPLFSIIENKFDESIDEINNYFDKFNEENDGITFKGSLYSFYIHVDFSITYTYGIYKIKYEGYVEEGATEYKLTITLDKDKVIYYLINQGLNVSNNASKKKTKEGKNKICVSLNEK